MENNHIGGVKNKERLIATMVVFLITVAYFYNPKQSDGLPKEVREKLELKYKKLSSAYRDYIKSGRESGHISGEGIKDLAEIYIILHAQIAEKIQNDHGIPASVVMAQALIESDHGTSDLALLYHNHFGIKHAKHCRKKFSGKEFKCCVQFTDDTSYDRFKKYKTEEDSFQDYVKLLQKKTYKDCFTCGLDYDCWARKLKAAGYATNPKYAEILIAKIKEYSLDQLDHPNDYQFKKEDLQKVIK